MDWEGLRSFSAAARESTLTAAARRLGLSVATTARRIDALEKALGLRLFDRSPGGIVLTTHGRALAKRVGAAVGSIDDIARLAASLRAGGWPDPIRVSSTEPVVAEILAPALPLLFSRAPGLRLEMPVSTDVVSLSARQADMAVRLARPAGDSLVARRLPDIGFGLFAARAYCAGRSAADLDLRHERLLGIDTSFGRVVEVAWMEEAGLADRLAMTTSSVRALVNATRAGAGIALLPRLLVRHAPELVEIPAPRPLPRRGAWLVWHRDLGKAQALRTVRDWIVEAFRGASTP